MFDIIGRNLFITAGDTRSFRLRPRAKVGSTPYQFTANDRALFTVTSGSTVMMERIFGDLQETSGAIVVTFDCGDTANWAAGQYQYDVRYIIDAIYNDDGSIAGGRDVITPMEPASITVKRSLGRVGPNV